MRKYLYLLKNYFGIVDSPGELHECENTIDLVFKKLTNKPKYCKIRVNEIRIKPAILYQGNHVIGYSCDKSLRPT